MPPPFEMPITFLLKTRFDTQEGQKELHRLEEEIGPDILTFKPSEAKLALGILDSKKKAMNELGLAGLPTEDVDLPKEDSDDDDGLPEGKRRKTAIGVGSGSETTSENEKEGSSSMKRLKVSSGKSSGNTIRVFMLQWYYDSVKAGKALPQDKYFVYEGRIIQPQKKSTPAKSLPKNLGTTAPRARISSPANISSRKFAHPRSSPASHGRSKVRPSQLVHEDTSDHEAAENMPPLPEHLEKRFSCERPTPMNSPNDDFIEQLKIIRHARDLESNDVAGHDFSAKSYSTAIASLKAYPHKITSAREIMRLPGCGDRVGLLWSEWHHNNGIIEEVKHIEGDERLQTLHKFWSIHGVADKTARIFYDELGFRDNDDIIAEYWDRLTIDQQIGVKYYDDLQLRIPRAEVEATEAIVLAAANSLHPGFQICTVGGYRRGKSDSGDMDFILSHPNENLTKNFLSHLLPELRESGHALKELTVSFRNSSRGQETLAWRGNDGKPRSGFDSLDHAFLVWQDPKNEDHPVRRVDIIISPWKTAGCAVLGWTGGTLFERDLRSYSKWKKGWKFDSTGLRVVATGDWVDLESRKEDKGREGTVTLEEKERRVFEGLELEYLPPTLRCTH